MIRALCLLDSSNKCIFRWADDEKRGVEWFGKLRKELSAGQLPKTIKDFLRAASLGNEDLRFVEFEGHPLALSIHRGFLIIAEVDSEDSCSRTMPLLFAEMDRAISENPLSFDQLLSDVDMPGKRKLINQFASILGGQGGRSRSS